MLLDINEMTRCGNKLKCVKRIIIHDTYNINEIDERNYINSLKYQDENYYSVHYIIGNNKCIRCIPEDEISYSTNNLVIDYTSISISCCFDTKNDEFNKYILNSLRRMIGYLCQKYDLKSKNIFFHSDITGSRCPKYLIDNRYLFDDLIKNII